MAAVLQRSRIYNHHWRFKNADWRNTTMEGTFKSERSKVETKLQFKKKKSHSHFNEEFLRVRQPRFFLKWLLTVVTLAPCWLIWLISLQAPPPHQMLTELLSIEKLQWICCFFHEKIQRIGRLWCQTQARQPSPECKIKLGDAAFTVPAMLHARDNLPREVRLTPTIQISKSRLK